jgi:hypothetical protein
LILPRPDVTSIRLDRYVGEQHGDGRKAGEPGRDDLRGPAVQDTVPGSAVHVAAEDHRDGTEVSCGCPLDPVRDGLSDGGGRLQVGDVEAREAVLEPAGCELGGFGVVAGDMDGPNRCAGSTERLA